MAELRAERSLLFRPFAGTQRVEELLAAARYNIGADKHAEVSRDAHGLECWLTRRGTEQARQAMAEALAVTEAGLQYFQTYDWPLLMCAVAAGYLGWILYVAVFFLRRRAPASVCLVLVRAFHVAAHIDHRQAEEPRRMALVAAPCALLFGYLLVQRMPLACYFYVAFPLYFWSEVLRHWGRLQSLARLFWRRPLAWVVRSCLVLGALEVLVCVPQPFLPTRLSRSHPLQVLAYFERGVLSLCLLLMAGAYAQAPEVAS